MALIETKDSPQFNPEEIHERDLMRAKYYTWPEPRNGLVATVRKDVLTVIFMPAIHRATRYFSIKAQEVADGKWELHYTGDMETIGKAGGETDGDIGSPDTAEIDDDI